MANALGRNLTGCVVLVRADSMAPGYEDPKQREFLVRDGFGAVNFTAGTAVFGTWLADGERGRISGFDVEAVVKEAPRRTRVVADVGSPGKWVAQYYDVEKQLWFDLGDPRDTEVEALAHLMEEVANEESNLLAPTKEPA